MVKGLYTAYTGMINEQHRMDTLTNNLANSTTVGFKKEGSTSQSFNAVLALKVKDTSEPANIPKRIGYNNPGVKIGENYTDWAQGSFKITDNTYDLALSGNGFFEIEFTNKAGETSTKYSRDGSFTLTQEGYLVTKDGNYVMGSKGRIKLDPLSDATVDQGGAIWQNNEVVDTLRIVDFQDYNYLKKYGENLMEPVEGAQFKDADYKVFSGYLEMSNVQIVTEMVDLIAITRQYEANQKIIKSIDSTLEIAANQLGRVNG
ncbi:flagellar basal-body rod protein FlgG [Lachnospiraceae bacterium YSD2013]|nr:flagellar basal-body rod protein FlgG [Lachnospiraceae bacterium YSD2013]